MPLLDSFSHITERSNDGGTQTYRKLTFPFFWSISKYYSVVLFNNDNTTIINKATTKRKVKSRRATAQHGKQKT